jgi:protoporphyrin/coproporphyrin ferrochelatase
MNRLGVLLLNLGGPDKLEDVRPFLYNLQQIPIKRATSLVI